MKLPSSTCRTGYLGLRLLLAALAIGVFFPVATFADRVTLDKPVKVAATKADKSKLAGRLTSYDETSFELVKGTNDKVEVAWSDLDAANVFSVRSAIITAKPDGQAWVTLGRDLRAISGGEKLSEKAFANALKLDPKLKEAVESARKEDVSKPTTQTAGNDDPANAGPDASTAASGAPGGPKMVGQATKGAWKVLTTDEQAAAMKELEAFAAETQKTMKITLVRHETDYFLFYSDLSPKEAQNWSGLLDKMYARLAELFGTGKEPIGGKLSNIWRGKALIFVFSKPEDYSRFQRLMHNTDSAGSAGMCHSFGNGDVHIAFYRQPDEKTFAHVLVHESVHGFLHRFKTPVPIPSWVNEGLAETIATELVPRAARGNEVSAAAFAGIKRNNSSLGGMFEATPIVAWQYPVAESITEFMIKQNKVNYVNFILGIKEGLTWQDSLQQKYKAGRGPLVKAFGDSLKIKDLKE